MNSILSSQIQSDLLRAFYQIFESYLQDKKGSLPILPLGQKSSTNINQTNASQTENFQSMIESVASKYQMDPNLVKAVVKTESNFDANAVSGAGR